MFNDKKRSQSMDIGEIKVSQFEAHNNSSPSEKSKWKKALKSIAEDFEGENKGTTIYRSGDRKVA